MRISISDRDGWQFRMLALKYGHQTHHYTYADQGSRLPRCQTQILILLVLRSTDVRGVILFFFFMWLPPLVQNRRKDSTAFTNIGVREVFSASILHEESEPYCRRQRARRRRTAGNVLRTKWWESEKGIVYTSRGGSTVGELKYTGPKNGGVSQPTCRGGHGGRSQQLVLACLLHEATYIALMSRAVRRQRTASDLSRTGWSTLSTTVVPMPLVLRDECGVCSSTVRLPHAPPIKTIA